MFANECGKADSGAKLVPMDPGPQSPVRLQAQRPEDSAELGASPIKKSSDSDVRLEAPSDRPGRKQPLEDSFLTEEIDLDAELRRAEAVRPKKKTPGTEPFELSEADLDVPKQPPAGAKTVSDSSSDFDITVPSKSSSSSVQLDRDRGKKTDEEVSLGDLPGSGGVASGSGVNLGRPTDSGISLEPESDSSDEIVSRLLTDPAEHDRIVGATLDILSASS